MQTPAPGGTRHKMSENALQRAVRNAVDEVTKGDERVRVAQTLATIGWGDVLFVDVYARSYTETVEDLDPALRQLVALFVDYPVGRITVRWRLNP